MRLRDNFWLWGHPEGCYIHVVSYEGLTTDFAQSIGAKFIIRGVRSAIDFEYERNIADVNRMLTGIDTILLISEPEYAAISSSMVRELAHFGKDISKYLPTPPENKN